MRARAHLRALMTQKSCVVGMRNAKLGNHLNNPTRNERSKSGAEMSTIIVFLAGHKTARLESDEQSPNKKPGRAHATKGIQTREVHAPGTCQTRGGHPG